MKAYDEPADMRDALVAAGACRRMRSPAMTTPDFGRWILIVRAKTVFGLTNFTIVTEEFHCPRAVWIAQRHGLNVVAFAAPDLSIRWSARVKLREALARTWCAVDLYVLNRQPKFSGHQEQPLSIAETAATR